MDKVKTPTSIFSAAILMFVYGGLLLFCGICGTASSAIQGDDAQKMQAEIAKEVPAMTAVSIVSNGSYFLVGILFIVSGVGVLRHAKVFRAMAYVGSAIIMIITIAGGIFTAVYIFPIQQRLIMNELQKNNPPMPFDMNKLMNASMAFGLLISIAIPLLFIVPTLILLNTKSARNAFNGIATELPDDDPYAIRRERRREDDDDDDDGYDNEPRPRRNSDDTGITDKGQ